MSPQLNAQPPVDNAYNEVLCPDVPCIDSVTHSEKVETSSDASTEHANATPPVTYSSFTIFVFKEETRFVVTILQ